MRQEGKEKKRRKEEKRRERRGEEGSGCVDGLFSSHRDIKGMVGCSVLSKRERERERDIYTKIQICRWIKSSISSLI